MAVNGFGGGATGSTCTTPATGTKVQATIEWPMIADNNSFAYFINFTLRKHYWKGGNSPQGKVLGVD